MAYRRREFLESLCALGAIEGLTSSSAAAGALNGFFDQTVAQAINPDFDPGAFDFWSGFLGTVAEPIASKTPKTRGGHPAGYNDNLPVFLHYGTEGFKNAAELDAGTLISEGDVAVSLNTSMIKVAPQDQETFDRLQNAQVRVDIAQKTPIVPMIEAMAYTVVSGLLTIKAEMSSKSKSAAAPKGGAKASAGGQSSGSKGASGSIQAISIESDNSWQKMQNIILPGGEGRWALNLEAQKKDSLFYKIMQNVVKEAGQFAPMIGLPGIAMSALQSFNNLYGAIHAQPVSIIKSNPLRVFATQEALQKTGAPGAATGIMLRSGTYILIPANRTPSLDSLKGLTVMQGRIVPPKTNANQLDAAAIDTLKDVTYVTFDIEAKPTRIFSGSATKKSG